MGNMDKPDNTDWKIITLLNEDGRMPSAEIARRLGNVSARTVTNRIEALTKKGIINIRAIVNPEMVGYGVLADVFIEVEPGRVREWLKELPNFHRSAMLPVPPEIRMSASRYGRAISKSYSTS